MELSFWRIFFLTLVSLSTYAQVPEGINYQAIVRDGSGSPVTTGPIAIDVTLSNGTSNYTETHNETPNSFGLVNFVIGTGLTAGDISTFDWTDAPTTINVQVGTDVIGNQVLQSVPYTLYAGIADSILGVDLNTIETVTASEGLTKVGSDIRMGGSLTNTVTVDMNGYELYYENGNEYIVDANIIEFRSSDGTFEMGIEGSGVSIGTGSAPAVLRYIDSNQGLGKVLTSDASGRASWQVPAISSSIADADADTRIEVEETNDSDKISFYSNGVENLTISQGGLIGIGQPNPTYPLTISGAVPAFGVDNGATFLAKNSVGTFETYFWPRWTDNVMYMNYGSGGFNIRNNTSTSALFIQADGDIGIGITDPAYDLEMKLGGTVSLNDGYIRNVKGFYLKDWDDDTGGGDSKYRLLGRDGSWQFYNGGVVVGSYANDTWTDLADGNLVVESKAMINTTTSDYPLRVNNSIATGTTAAATTAAEFTGDNEWGTAINITNTTSSSTWRVMTAGSNHPDLEPGSFAITDGNSSNYALTLNSVNGMTHLATASGYKVALGYAPSDVTPTYKLQLPNSTTLANGRALSNQWATYSDNRVKFDQLKIQYGLMDLLKLVPKEYEHHDSKFVDGKLVVDDHFSRTIGFIAQEVYKVIPEAAAKPVDETKALWGMDYNKLVPVIVNAIKEEDVKVEVNKEDIAKLVELVKLLEQQVKEQQTEINALKK